jgi:hypothetical protein
LFFAGILKVNDENRRIRIQDPDPDPLVRGMDLRIRNRINVKILMRICIEKSDPNSGSASE